MKKAKRKNPAFGFLFPAVLLMLLFFAFPIVYNFVISFLKWSLKYAEHPFVGFNNYIKLIGDDSFFEIIGNTLVWTFLGVALQMILGIALAMFVDGMTKGQKFMRTILLIPWVIPGVVTALMWKFMLQSDIGLVNFVLQAVGITQSNIQFLSDSKLAMFTLVLVNTWKATPFWFLMITAGLQTKPLDQIEAARVDGAGFWTIFRKIILPHLSSIIASTGVLTSIWTLNYFDLIWVITKGGPKNATTTLPIQIYRLAFEENNFGRSAACAVVSLFIVVLISIPYIKKIFGDLKEEGVL